MRNQFLFLLLIFLGAVELAGQITAPRLLLGSDPLLKVTGEPSSEKIGINLAGQCYLIDKDGLKETLEVDSVSWLKADYWKCWENSLCGVYQEGKGVIIPSVFDDVTIYMSGNGKPVFVVERYGLYSIVDDQNQQLFAYREKKYAPVFLNDTILNVGSYRPEVYAISGRAIDKKEQEQYKEPYFIRESSSNYILKRYENGAVQKDTFSGNSSFKYDVAIVKKGEKWGCIKKDGSWLFPPEFDIFQPFNDDRVAVVKKGEFSGIVNTEGEFVVPMNYSSVSYLNSEYFVSNEDKNKRLIEIQSQKTILSGPFSKFVSAGKNYFGAYSGDSLIVFHIDGEQVPVDGVKAIIGNDESENLVLGLRSKSNSRRESIIYGLMDPVAGWLIKPVLTGKVTYSNHFFLSTAQTSECCYVNGISFEKNSYSNWILFSSEGKPLLPFDVEYVNEIKGKPFLIYKKDGKFGLLNSEGEKILEDQSFINVKDGNWVIFSKNGNQGLYYLL